jgi:hypothetical protein
LVERENRTIKQMLRTVGNQTKDDWDDHLPYIMMAYRATIQESTGCTPNLLMLNRETNLPVDLMYETRNHDPFPSCPQAYVEWIRGATQKAFENVRQHLGQSAERQKRLYDRGKGVPTFQAGDWVWRFMPAREKLAVEWNGPYLLLRRTGEVNYEIQYSAQANPIVVHVDHLKLYEGSDEMVSWLPVAIDCDEGGCDKATQVGVDLHEDEPQINGGKARVVSASAELETVTDTNSLPSTSTSMPPFTGTTDVSRRSERPRKPVQKLNL